MSIINAIKQLKDEVEKSGGKVETIAGDKNMIEKIKSEYPPPLTDCNSPISLFVYSIRILLDESK